MLGHVEPGKNLWIMEVQEHNNFNINTIRKRAANLGADCEGLFQKGLIQSCLYLLVIIA